MERTNKRFDNYANSGLLCGTDGLPHLIADPGLAVKYGHAGDVFIPTFGFLYFAGLLGHAGRIYLHAIKGDKNQEIIINVPLAFSSFGKAFGWPMMVLGELKNGTLTEKEVRFDHGWSLRGFGSVWTRWIRGPWLAFLNFFHL